MGTLSGDFYSRSLRVTQHVNIIIPDTSEDFWTVIDDELRVLYLLHGLGSNADEWVRFSMIEAYAKIYDLAVIMPDGNRSFYQNMGTGPRYFDWIAYELPSIVHEWLRLPQDREHTFIAGESMGGYGALRIALERPDAFAGCAALSSVTDPQMIGREFPDLMWGMRELEAIFGEGGPTEKDSIISYARDAVKAWGADAMPRIMQVVGDDDPFKPFVKALAEELGELGLDSSFESWSGRHDFMFWNGAIERALRSFCGLSQE